MNYSAQKGWRQTPEWEKRVLQLLWHNDPKNQIDESTRKRGEYGYESVEDTDESRVPTEPFGESTANATDHAILG